MAAIFNAVFFSVLTSHLIVDVLNGQRSVLFAYLSDPLGLSNTDIGFYTTLTIVLASVLQIGFGYLADRFGPRLLVAGGVAWIALFYAVGILTPGVAGLAVLVVAGIGSGMFHPAGTMQATVIGREVYAGRETTAAAVFFLFGQVGLFLGPLLSGFLLERVGVYGLLGVSAAALPVAVFAWWALRGVRPAAKPDAGKNGAGEAVVRVGALALLAFSVLAAFQAWAQQNMMAFLPKYLSDLGQSPTSYGLLAALFMGGSALGNVIGGSLADRYGKRRVAASALTLASIPLFIISIIGWSPWLYVLIPLAGAFSGSTHSIIVVLAQRMIPSGMALASGLILGFMFASGALGALLSGYIADLWGFPVMFQFTVGLVLAAALLSATLQKT